MPRTWAAWGAALVVGCAGSAPATDRATTAIDWHARDAFTLVAPENPLAAVPARNADGSVNALVEIPAGTNAKWELRKADGALVWELRDGQPRVVRFLAYPGNYGLIPRTLLATEDGGDGDPLDVIVLGPALPRGAIVAVELVGVLRMLDRGERDDKLLAVAPDSPFAGVRDVAELDARFPGVTDIIETWFSSYKGPGAIETRGFGKAAEAGALLERAERAFQRHSE
jgi:inorganic pyrophosphatase